MFSIDFGEQVLAEEAHKSNSADWCLTQTQYVRIYLDAGLFDGFIVI